LRFIYICAHYNLPDDKFPYLDILGLRLYHLGLVPDPEPSERADESQPGTDPERPRRSDRIDQGPADERSHKDGEDGEQPVVPRRNETKRKEKGIVDRRHPDGGQDDGRSKGTIVDEQAIGSADSVQTL